MLFIQYKSNLKAHEPICVDPLHPLNPCDYSNLLEICIRISRIVELVNPEKGQQLAVADVGDIVGVPHWHVHIGGLITIENVLRDL